MRKYQTATEYLIILAVVIIIAIIVIVALGGIPNIGGKSGDRASSAKLASGDIGLIEYAISNGSTVLTLRNNQGESARISAVFVDNTLIDCTPSSPILLAGESVQLICDFIGAPKTRYEYDLNVTYTSLDVSHNKFVGKITGTIGVSELDYTGGPLAIDGVCGSAIEGTHDVAPNDNLCSSGRNTSVEGNGPWTWICEGENGGQDSSLCQANVPFTEEMCTQQNLAGFYNGSGTSESPYGICNISMLQNIKNHLSSNFVLLSNIDGSVSNSWNGGQGFEPIGSCGPNYECQNNDDSFLFTGNFNGNGFTIFGIEINRNGQSEVGLFGRTKNAKISNLRLEGSLIRGYFYAGTLIGMMQANTSIENCHINGSVYGNTMQGLRVGGLSGGANSDSNIITNSSFIGSVEGYDQLGGLVGILNGDEILNSFFIGTVTGRKTVGGLIGYSGGSEISDSYSIATVEGLENVGGLIGYSAGSTISDSYSISNVTAQGNYVFQQDNSIAGGLIGKLQDGEVHRSYSEGSVITTDAYSGQAGGLVGRNEGGDIYASYSLSYINGTRYAGGLAGFASGGIISNSYSRGDILSGNGYEMAGFIGVNDGGAISNSYSTGFVNNIYSGRGFIGTNLGSISSSYYDVNLSNKSDTGHGEPKTTAEMKQQATFQNWDFSTIWSINEGSDYPKLRWQEQ